MDKSVEQIQAEHGHNSAEIMHGWMDAQDEIRATQQPETGAYLDRLTPEQRLALRNDQALEKAEIAHERIRQAYHEELDRYEAEVASTNNVKYLMWTMLGDGQLLKNDKGKYYPTNPTNITNPANPVGNGDAMVSGLVDGPGATNRTFVDTYTGNGASVSEVSEVSGHRRLTAAEAERVQALISQGMSPKLARAEVLGEEV